MKWWFFGRAVVLQQIASCQRKEKRPLRQLQKSALNRTSTTSLRHRQHNHIMDMLDQIPKPLLGASAIIGALFMGIKIFNYIRLLFSLFVLSGKNVCPHPNVMIAELLAD